MPDRPIRLGADAGDAAFCYAPAREDVVQIWQTDRKVTTATAQTSSS
jgi:hypothetical protein